LISKETLKTFRKSTPAENWRDPCDSMLLKLIRSIGNLLSPGINSA